MSTITPASAYVPINKASPPFRVPNGALATALLYSLQDVRERALITIGALCLQADTAPPPPHSEVDAGAREISATQPLRGANFTAAIIPNTCWV